MNVKELSIAGILAAIYTVLCYALHPFSFMAIQVRVACAMIPLIALYKFPAMVGIVLGHFLVNLSSPLGPLDLLAVLLFIPAKLLIMRYGVGFVPLHVMSVAVYVGSMLHTLFGLPLGLTMLTVGVGEAIAEIGLGLPLYYALRWRNLR